jgi:hypothetical protein
MLLFLSCLNATEPNSALHFVPERYAHMLPEIENICFKLGGG